MPDLLTPQALAAAGPIVIETLFKHFFGPKPSGDKGKARDDLMYDEAFVLMKMFLEIATKYPCAALQRFGQVRTLAPPWVAVHRVQVPPHSLNIAADIMIQALGGEEMAYKIAGGTKWWQVRAGHGVEAEWIVMKRDWKGVVEEERRERETKNEKREQKEKDKEEAVKSDGNGNGDGQEGDSEEESEFRPEMDRLRCMLYIHGGAYYWGSINTHRYTIWRYARKMHGRCFAVNYRKTPQYPFPCAIHDCLAAYVYLTNPPPGAQHRPVDPKSIILAGDSAGGGLVLALLQILRDTEGYELPAGAVLISPWSDLTHSFPSILQNTATDIVPPYGFIHKPSSLWPPPPPMLTDEVQSRLRSRVKEAVSRVRHNPHMAEEAHQKLTETLEEEPNISMVKHDTTIPDKLKTSKPDGGLKNSKDQSESDLHPLADKSEQSHPEPQTEPTRNPSRANPADLFAQLVEGQEGEMRPSTLAQCTTPLKITVKGEEVLIDTQIQLYATNAQLCHPWVSPVLGYLGGLPPLYVLCGDKEVLRDEIIFVAHKAANPEKYPIRDDVRAMLPSLQGIEEKYGPTNVHLQVYDGVCHDLPLLSMTRPARGAFRAITSFARYVTPSAPGSRYISRSKPNTPRASTTNMPSLNGSASHSQPSSSRQSELGFGTGGASPTSKTSNQNMIEDTLMIRPMGSDSREDDTEAVSEPKVSATPEVMSPDQSIISSGTKYRAERKVPILDLSLGSEIPPGEIPNTTDRPLGSAIIKRDSLVPSPLSPPPTLNHRNVSFSSVNSNASSSAPQSPRSKRDSILPPSPATMGRNGDGSGSFPPLGDEAGPRFEQDDTLLEAWAAKEGEAGWAGIYKGDNPFTDHMIRERVSTTGSTRPLEPASELGGMQMPLDEAGYLKEGPVMRYINGQALWDKKYRRAAKTVTRKREKNLKIAHREGRKIGMEWLKRAREKHGLDGRKMEGPADEPGTGGERDGEGNVDEGEGNDILDQSWSWTWALNGEAPPPSAVVSRRDFAEARQLALMADRLDSAHDSSFHGLTIWVGLASFFSHSSDRGKASDALKAIKEARKAQEGNRKGKSKGKVQGNGKGWPHSADGDEDGWSDEDAGGDLSSSDGEEQEQHEAQAQAFVDSPGVVDEDGHASSSSATAINPLTTTTTATKPEGKNKSTIKAQPNAKAVGGERPARRKKGLVGWFTFWKKK
ncbi:hypothetical protein IAU59_006846 [Kwoniella sp. CBS 9459]